MQHMTEQILMIKMLVCVGVGRDMISMILTTLVPIAVYCVWGSDII